MSAPPPAGGIHLLVADDALPEGHRSRIYLAVCGAERAVALAAGLHPQVHPFRGCQAMYWVDYGRALRMRRRREDAVLAFRRAELISPRRVLRDPITREVLAELLAGTRRGSPAGRELQAMAYRAGLPR